MNLIVTSFFFLHKVISSKNNSELIIYFKFKYILLKLFFFKKNHLSFMASKLIKLIFRNHEIRVKSITTKIIPLYA